MSDRPVQGLMLVGLYGGTKPVTKGDGELVAEGRLQEVTVQIPRTDGSVGEWRARYWTTQRDNNDPDGASVPTPMARSVEGVKEGDRVAIRVTAAVARRADGAIYTNAKGDGFVNFEAKFCQALDGAQSKALKAVS